MTEQPLDPEHYRMMSNAGRCDICGRTVDMESGDTLVLQEYGMQDEEAAQEYGYDDQEAIDAVADAMEAVADSGAGLELAKVIREEGEIRTHGECLDETNFSMLETEADRHGGEQA